MKVEFLKEGKEISNLVKKFEAVGIQSRRIFFVLEYKELRNLETVDLSLQIENKKLFHSPNH